MCVHEREEREREKEKGRKRGRETERATEKEFAPMPWLSLLGHTLNQWQMLFAFDQTTQLSLSSLLPPLLLHSSSSSKGTKQNQLSVNKRTPQTPSTSSSTDTKPTHCSLCSWETPCLVFTQAATVSTLVWDKCYYGLTRQQFSLFMKPRHQPVKQLLPFLFSFFLVGEAYCRLPCWSLTCGRMLVVVPQQRSSL